MRDFKQPKKLIKKKYLNNINNSNNPFIIYKTIKGFNLFTDFSKKITLNNKNIINFLNQKHKSQTKYKDTDLMIGFFGYASILTQLSGLVIVGIFTIIVTYTLIKITALITPLRVDEEIETNGLDLSVHGERAYDVNS